MKKVAFILALFFIAFVHANEISNNNKTINDDFSRYRYNQPLKFIERGVEFFVFPNGEFDFNTHPRYHRSRRGNGNVSINTTYGSPRNYHNNRPYRGVRVEHDRYGKVRRIGNIFINYDSRGRIKRIGNIYMNYRRNLLTNIGGLHIYYNRHCRVVRTTGSIRHDIGCHFCGAFSCTTNHYNGNNHWNNDQHDDHNDNWDDDDHYGNDDDMYYYRNKNGKASKSKNKKK